MLVDAVPIGSDTAGSDGASGDAGNEVRLVCVAAYLSAIVFDVASRLPDFVFDLKRLRCIEWALGSSFGYSCSLGESQRRTKSRIDHREDANGDHQSDPDYVAWYCHRRND